jgi:hypothetical protein
MKKNQSEVIDTSRYEICQVAGISRGRDQYKAIIESLKRLTSTRIDLDKWVDRAKGKTEPIMFNTMLSGGIRRDTEKIQVTINPYFREMFAGGLTTNIDIDFRRKLKGDTAKAIYRFLSSQRPFYKKNKYEIHLLKICKAINIENPQLFKMRESIRKGLKELRQKGFIKRWMVNKSDIVTVWK